MLLTKSLPNFFTLVFVKVKNPFRGSDKDPNFCNPKAVRDLIKKVLSSTGLSTKQDAKVEELLCIAIEMRMTEFLRKLARAGRAAEDATATLGPIKIKLRPEEELKKLAGIEEVEQARKAKKIREELEKIAETNAEDVRVQQMLDDQARVRAAAAASEAAIQMARGGKKTLTTSSSSSAAAASASAAVSAVRKPQPDSEVRVAQMKQQEGEKLTGEEEKLLADWERRSASVSAGKRKVDEARQRSERRVGMKELMFVMDSDPYFKSVRMQTSIKAGFLGRGVVGETRALIRE